MYIKMPWIKILSYSCITMYWSSEDSSIKPTVELGGLYSEIQNFFVDTFKTKKEQFQKKRTNPRLRSLKAFYIFI